MYMNNPTLQNCSSRSASNIDRYFITAMRKWSEMRYCLIRHTIRSAQENIVGIAQPRCIFCNRIEHSLKVIRRASDHPEDLARSPLLLQGFVPLLGRCFFSLQRFGELLA
jgi:hypothetical protein